MNRRGFLQGILAACAAPAVITTPGLIMPIKAIAAPALPLTIETYASRFLSVDMITRQALQILHQRLDFIDRPGSYLVTNSTDRPATIRIRLPERYTVRT